MSKLKTVAAIAVAVSATLLSAQMTMAQGCATCSGGGGYVDAGYNYAGSGGPMVGNGYFNESSGFGYPGGSAAGCGDCDGCRGGSGCFREQWKQNWEHTKQINQKVMARNQAWPKPFACADRQLYFRMWEPMIDAGMQDLCTLSSSHFSSETQELNSYGESAVASIMQNMPASRKAIFIQRTSNELVSDTRMNSVRGTVEKWYGHVPAPSIAYTNNYPIPTSASRIEVINTMYNQETPAPMIAVGDSTASTSSTGQ